MRSPFSLRSDSAKGSSRWPYLLMAVLVGALLLLGWVAVQSTRTTPAPPKFELVTESVSLKGQTVILVDVPSDSGFYHLLLEELEPTLHNLEADERICILPVGPDVPLLKVAPWCSDQYRKSWWRMPDAPPSNASPEVQAAFIEARPVLRGQLHLNEERSAESWESKKPEIPLTVKRLFSQLSVPTYLDIKGSLRVLLGATRQGDKATVPTAVVIYSWMKELLYDDTTNNREVPQQLYGSNVQVNLLSSDGGVELTALQAAWDPWFQTGHPESVRWKVIDVSSLSHQPLVSFLRSPRSPHIGHVLPPVVPKPEFMDATSVVNGSERPLETNIIEGEVGANLR